MNWARSKTSDWKPSWFLALMYEFANRPAAALAMLDSIGEPSFGPLYAVRASLTQDSATKETYLKKAVTLDPQEWRYRNLLAEYYLQCGRSSDALQVVKKFHKQHPANYMTGIVYIRALMRNQQYSQAETELDKIVVLPYENASYAHNLYRETKLMLANELMAKRQFKKALTKIDETSVWPLSLGAGKPYPDQIDDRFEHWMKWQCHTAIGDSSKAMLDLQALRKTSTRRMDFAGLLLANILKQNGDTQKAAQAFDNWAENIQDPVLKQQASEFFANNRGFNSLLQTITGRMD
jgi:predicted Zn-dependent protease